VQRKIIHIDMDCFYAAVEVKHNPSLKGKPIAVGGPANSRGVLTTASYEARKFGCRSAMPSSQAVRLCPDLILIPPNFERYKKESRAVHKILSRFTDLIEPLSLDEAYLDVTQSPHHGGSATLIAQEIRARIREETGLTASAGIAPNKFLAKIASDWKKPDGQFVIRPQDIEAFMPPLKVEKIHGVGKVTARKMHELGLFTCGDIQKRSVAELTRWFGSRGAALHDRAFGIDHREVDDSTERKSLTVEETFAEDLARLEECLAEIPALYEDLIRRIKKYREDEKISGFVVKLKFHDFKTTTHECASKAWPKPSDFETLLTTAWERRRDPVRLIGIGVRLTSGAGQEADPDQLRFEFDLE
jgi:DNA polymerase-4